MALQITDREPGVPTWVDDSVRPERRTGDRPWVRRVGPVAGLVCWFYLSIVACLVVWVLVVRVLVGWTPLVVTTGSMRPSINEGDIVLSAPPEDGGRALADGTVITFADPVRPGGHLTHRIDRVNDDGTYETKGDANAVTDSYRVQPRDIEGVGRLLVPSVGLPRVWLEQGNLPMLLVWGLGTLLALWAALRPSRPPRHG